MKNNIENPKNLYALINGGSQGIGYAVASALAKQQYNLILTARGQANLDAAKEKFHNKYGIDVHIIAADLTKKDCQQEIINYCQAQNLKVFFLANVIGLSGDKDFLSLPLEKLKYMIKLNIESVISATLLMIPLLDKNSPSYIMNVSSLAGFAPIPKKNVYAATKSAIIFFSTSLHQQLMPRNIHVSCLCPGPVYTTESIKKTTKENLGWLADKIAVAPATVGEIAVKKTLQKKVNHHPWHGSEARSYPTAPTSCPMGGKTVCRTLAKFNFV